MAINEHDIRKIQEKYSSIKDCLSEKGRRIWAVVEATAYGYGGSTMLCKALAMSTATLSKGKRDLKNPDKNKGKILRTTQKFIQQLQMQKSYFQLYPWKACILQKIDQPYI